MTLAVIFFVLFLGNLCNGKFVAFLQNESNDNICVQNGLSCPAVDGPNSIYYALPDCTKFCQCSNGALYVHNCPAFLHFNPVLNVCDYPDEAGCVSVDANTTTQSTTTDSTTTTTDSTTITVDSNTTTTTQASTTISDNICKQENISCPSIDGENSIYAPVSDCTKFCQCSNGVPYLHVCPFGLHFNPTLNVCDWEDEAGCTGGSATKATSTTEKTTKSDETEEANECLQNNIVCPTVDGPDSVYKPLPDCTKFCQCSNGVPYLHTCPFGLEFNPTLNVCDWPEDAGCTGSATTSSETTQSPAEETTSQSTTTTAASGDDICVQNNIVCPAIDGLDSVYKPLADCTKFCQCSNGVPYLHTCPFGLEFNPTLNVCDWPEDAGCTGGATTSSETTQSPTEETTSQSTTTTAASGDDICVQNNIVCPAVDGPDSVYKPLPDCTKFCQCSNGVPYSHTCPFGLEFNPTLNVCDWPEDAGCTGGKSTTVSSSTTEASSTATSSELTEATTEITTTEENTSADTTENTSSTTSGDITESSTENSTTEESSSSTSSEVNSTTEESTTNSPTEDSSSTASITDETTSDGTTEDSSSSTSTDVTESSTENSTTEESTSDSTTEDSTSTTTAESISVDTTEDLSSTACSDVTESTTDDSTSSTIEESTSDSTIEVSSSSTSSDVTESSNENSTTEESTSDSTTEDSTSTTTAESTSVDPTEDSSFTACSDVTESTTDITATEDSTSDSTTDDSTSSTIEESTSDSTTEDSFSTVSSGTTESSSEITTTEETTDSTTEDNFSTTDCISSDVTESSTETTTAEETTSASTTENSSPSIDAICLQSSIVCPEVDGPDSIYGALPDCTKFCQCSKGVPYLHICPTGLFFNPILNVCDWPENAGCVGDDSTTTEDCATTTNSSIEISTTEETTSQSSTSTASNLNRLCLQSSIVCPAVDGLDSIYGALSDCTKFCQCSNGVPYLHTCPAGLNFNPSLNVCDWPQNAGCTTA